MAHNEIEESVQVGKFEWKIKRFIERQDYVKKSPSFMIGRCNSFLRLTETSMFCESLYSCSPIYLETESRNSFDYKTFYKLSLVDRNGKAFLLTKRSPLNNVSKSLLLTSIELFNFLNDRRNFLPGGTLTLRLSWGEEDAVCKCNSMTLPDLTTETESYNSFDYKTFYKLSLVDRNGREFLLAKRTPLNKESQSLLLTSIDSFKFQYDRRNFLPEGTLTLRLSWGEEDAVCKCNSMTMPDLTTEKKSISCLETLSKDFSRLYESKTGTDCMLRVAGAQFPVHRQVLSTRSEVFGAMFLHDTSESHSGVVDITDVDGDIMHDFLHYVYSGQIRGLTPNTAIPMYVVADKYALVELRDICLDLLKCNLTVENVCDAAVLAHAHGEMDLENKVIMFIEEKLEDLVKSQEWQNFSKDKSMLCIQLLQSAMIAGKHKKLSAKSGKSGITGKTFACDYQ